MLITITGEPGSGKTTVGKALAKKFRYDFIAVGEKLRKIAEKEGKSILELMKNHYEFEKVQEKIESYLDGLKGRDDLVVDGRDAFLHIPQAFKIFLKVNDHTAAKRIFEAERIGKPKFSSVAESLEALRQRKDREQKLYLKMHKVDIYDLSNYDLVIDTTHTTVEEVLDIIEMRL